MKWGVEKDVFFFSFFRCTETILYCATHYCIFVVDRSDCGFVQKVQRIRGGNGDLLEYEKLAFAMGQSDEMR